MKHEMQNIGWNHFVCKNCGLDEMAVVGITVCPGVKGKHVCPWQSNIETNGHCSELFDNREDAVKHWKEEHQGLTGDGACDHFGLPNWLQRLNDRLKATLDI
jgi:hypothetical protein